MYSSTSHHPPNTFQSYDYAIIKLPKAFTIDVRYINPICLPLGVNKDWSKGLYNIAGWGYGERESELLEYAEVQVVPKMTCYKKWNKYLPTTPYFFRNNSICVEGYSGPLGACVGDKGGPLFWQHPFDELRGYIVGLASFEDKFCDNGENNGPLKPFKYAYIPKVIEWIMSLGDKELIQCLPTRP